MDGEQVPPARDRLSVTGVTTTVVSILAGVAVAAVLAVRQLRAEPVSANYRLPLILGIIGLIELPQSLSSGQPR